MRTMAYVETRDGTQLNPNGGGIRSISEEYFNFMKYVYQSNSNRIIMELEYQH